MAESICQLSATQIVFPGVQVDVVNGRRRIVSQRAVRTIPIANQTDAPVTLTIQAAALWLSCSFGSAGRTITLDSHGSTELEIALNDDEFGRLNEGSTVGQISISGSPTNECWKVFVTLRLHLPAGDGSSPTPGNPPAAFEPFLPPMPPQPPMPPVFPPPPPGPQGRGWAPFTPGNGPAAAHAPGFEVVKFEDKTPLVSPVPSPAPSSHPAGSTLSPLPDPPTKRAARQPRASRVPGIRRALVAPLFGLLALVIGRGANAAAQQRYSNWHGQLSPARKALLLSGGVVANGVCGLVLATGLYHLGLVLSRPPALPTIHLAAVKGTGPRPEFDCRLEGVTPEMLLYLEAKVDGGAPRKFSLRDPATGKQACAVAKSLHMEIDGALPESGDYSFRVLTRDAFGRDCYSNTQLASIRIPPKRPEGFITHIDPDHSSDALKSNDEHRLRFEWERPTNPKISRAILTRIEFDPKTRKSLDATELYVIEDPTSLPLTGRPPKTLWVAPDMIKVASTDDIKYIRYGLHFEARGLIGETKLSRFFRIQYNHDVIPVDDPEKAIQDETKWSKQTVREERVPKVTPMEPFQGDPQSSYPTKKRAQTEKYPGRSKSLPEDYNPLTYDPTTKPTPSEPGDEF